MSDPNFPQGLCITASSSDLIHIDGDLAAFTSNAQDEAIATYGIAGRVWCVASANVARASSSGARKGKHHICLLSICSLRPGLHLILPARSHGTLDRPVSNLPFLN